MIAWGKKSDVFHAQHKPLYLDMTWEMPRYSRVQVHMWEVIQKYFKKKGQIPMEATLHQCSCLPGFSEVILLLSEIWIV